MIHILVIDISISLFILRIYSLVLFTLIGRVDSVCGMRKLLYAVDNIRLEDLCVQGTTPS